MTEVTHHYYVIIPHPQQPKILMFEGESGWSLPQLAPSEKHRGATQINEAVRSALGINSILLRCAHYRYDPDQSRAIYVEAMENHSPDWTPTASGRWVSGDEVRAWRLPLHEAVLEQYFVELETGQTPPLRVAWALPGWFATVTAWIHEQLDHLHIEATGPVEQIRAWSITCMLRVSTDAGDLYFKAVPPMFAREPLLTRYMAGQYPEHIPNVLAVDVERRWLLMRDFKGEILGENPDAATWEKALRRYAEIQVEQIGHVSDLLALGCADRRLDDLTARMEAMLADTASMLPGDPRGLSEEEISRLRALAPRLNAMTDELANCGIPYTLAHGDFHTNNLATNGEQIIYYDWTDGCIAFPFFDLIVFLEDSPLPDVSDARSRLRDAYLAPWTSFAPMSRLLDILVLAYPLGTLYQALSYWDIRLNTEPSAQWELEDGVPYWLKLVLRSISKVSNEKDV